MSFLDDGRMRLRAVKASEFNRVACGAIRHDLLSFPLRVECLPRFHGLRAGFWVLTAAMVLSLGFVREAGAEEGRPNLVKNSGFEEGLKGWSLEAEARLEDVSIGNSPDGNYLQIRNTAKNKVGVMQNISLIQQELRPIHLRYRIMAESLGPKALATYHLGLRYFDGTVEWVSGSLPATQSDVGRWVSKEQIVYPSRALASVSIYCLNYSDVAVVDYDDLELKVLDQPFVPSGPVTQVSVLEDMVLTGKLAPQPGVAGSFSYSLIKPTGHGTLSLKSDGNYTYTPNFNYSGTDDFYYRTSDGTVKSDVATLKIDVTSVNDAPVWIPLSVLLDPKVNERVQFRVQGKDVDGDTLTYRFADGAPAGAKVDSVSGAFSWIPPQAGTYKVGFIASDGRLDSPILQKIIAVTSPASAYPDLANLVQNAGFENGLQPWKTTAVGAGPIVSTSAGYLQIGNTDVLSKDKSLVEVRQELTLDMPLQAPVFYLRCQVKAESLGANTIASYGVGFRNTDGTTDWYSIKVTASDLEQWVYKELTAFSLKTVKGVTLYVHTKTDLGVVDFDDLELKVVSAQNLKPLPAAIEKNIAVGQNLDFTVPSSLGDDLVTNQSLLVRESWKVFKNYYYQTIVPLLQQGDAYQPYNIQVYTNNYLEYALAKKDIHFLDELLELFMDPYQYLEVNAKGERQWIYRDINNPEMTSLIGKEHRLSAGQYMYMMTRALRGISEIPSSEQTPTMREFCSQYAPFALEFYSRHYKDVLTACNTKLNNGASFKDSRNAVNDSETWIMAGVTELLAARAHRPDRVMMTSEQETAFKNFVTLGCQLLESRLTPSALKDFSGQEIQGLNFDLGMWDYYADYAYSGYTGTDYPGWKVSPDEKVMDPLRAVDVGWDISHARRFVNVFNTLYDNQKILGLSFPSKAVMTGLTHQVVYGVSNKDLNNPLFSNYMDGTNGWYRVNYVNRPGFGYAPYALSYAIPAGGYGLWSQFHPDMMKIMLAINDLMCGRGNAAAVKDWQNRMGTGVRPSNNLGSFLASLLSEQLPVRFSFENAPQGLSLELRSGRMTWTPATHQTGFYEIHVKIANGFQEANQIIKIHVVQSAGAWGEISEDGQITAHDARLVAQYAVELIKDPEIPGLCNGLTAEEFKRRGDVDGNPGLSANDAMLIARRAVGLIDRFPVEG